MSGSKKLTDAELQDILDHLSDISSAYDDDIGDPDYSSKDASSGDCSYEDDYDDNESVQPSNENEEDVSINQPEDDDVNKLWFTEVINISRLVFSGQSGCQRDIEFSGQEMQPIDVFKTIINQEIIDLMVIETNRYAAQLLQTKRMSRSCRLSRWKDTDKAEMERFIGVLLLMGILQFPSIECYWKLDSLYYHPVFHRISLSYNRFVLLLKCWHFVDNQQEHTGRLYKITPLLDAIISTTQKLYIPADTVVVDETMIPFRERLFFRQYNPSKASRYGKKLFKVCTPEGFTWNVSIYSGTNKKLPDLDLPGSTVINLTKDLLNEGRLVITDNYYTSVELAKYLYTKNTNLIGTVRKNRKGLDPQVVKKQVSKGEICSAQQQYMTFAKWRDQRDVLMLSTCYGDEMIDVGKDRQGNTKFKPKLVVEYNKGKQGVDISDQLASYYSSLRKSLIWYKKIAIELKCSTTLVNSHILFTSLTNNKITLLEFTESIIKSLLSTTDENTSQAQPTPAKQLKKAVHKLEDIKDQEGRLIRKRCHGCYCIQKEQGLTSKEAGKKAKRVTTMCNECSQVFCLPCFNKKH